MEQEHFLSGYCRSIDGSRTVTAITEKGELTEVDCGYEACPHKPACQIAQRIKDLIRILD